MRARSLSVVLLVGSFAVGCANGNIRDRDFGSNSGGNNNAGGSNNGGSNSGGSNSGGNMSTGGSGGTSSAGSGGSGGSLGEKPPVAPNGYYTRDGTNQIFNSNDQPHIFRGVDRPSLEWNTSGENLSSGDYQEMASWGFNVVRIALSQDFWLSNNDGYHSTVNTNVEWAKQAGMDVILELHRWNGAIQPMANRDSITFWKQVAAQYQNDGRVMFELYNEPHDISWGVWKNGDNQYAGMQEMYDAVRAQGADNLVLAGGLDWAYNLSNVPSWRLEGYNIAYATHVYKVSGGWKAPDKWQSDWGFVADVFPVVVTEFGTFDDSGGCDESYYEQVIQTAEDKGIGWTAWAWYADGDQCNFPTIISNWSGQPNSYGQIVQKYLP